MDRADAAPDARVGERAAAARKSSDGGEVPYLGERLGFGRGAERRAERDHVSRRGARASRERCRRNDGPARGARALVPAPRADRGGAAARRRRGARGAQLHDAPDPRPAHPLGELLHERRDELQLAAAARAGRDPRLRGRARGGPPRRAGPLAALLAPAGRALPRAGASTRRGCAAHGHALRL